MLADEELPPVSWAQLMTMMQNMVKLGESLDGIKATQDATTETLHSLAKQVTKGSKSALKFKEPAIFTGKATQVVGFLQEIKDTLYLLRHSYVTDKDKCVYMSTYLGPGTPKEWYNAVLKLSPESLDSFDIFTAAFSKHFGDSNLVATAQHKLDELRQTGSAAQYAARFMEYIVHLDVTEASKIHFFQRHLKLRVKNAIALATASSRPTTLKTFIDWVIEIDNSLHERELDQKRYDNTKALQSDFTSAFDFDLLLPSQATPPTSSSETTLPLGEPMVIDALAASKARGPLTDAERLRRFQLGLCTYCGGSGHKIASCPNMSAKAKQLYEQRQATSATSSTA